MMLAAGTSIGKAPIAEVAMLFIAGVLTTSVGMVAAAYSLELTS